MRARWPAASKRQSSPRWLSWSAAHCWYWLSSIWPSHSRRLSARSLEAASGGRSSGCRHDVRVGLRAGISDLRATVRPLRTQANPGPRNGRAGGGHCRLGGGLLAADGGGAAKHPGSLRGELLHRGLGVRRRGAAAAVAANRNRRDVDRLPVGRHSRSGLCAGSCGSSRLALGVRTGRAGICDCRHRYCHGLCSSRRAEETR